MFSKALFKQSCKANGLMWTIITVAICFMLSCVMLISGSGNIGKVKDSVEDTIITAEINSILEKKSLNYYNMAKDGLSKFDEKYVISFNTDFEDVSNYAPIFKIWVATKPVQSNYATEEEYQLALKQYSEAMPKPTTIADKLYAQAMSEWSLKMPVQSSFDSIEKYTNAMLTWATQEPNATTVAPKSAYLNSILSLEQYILTKFDIIETTQYFDENGSLRLDMLTKDQNEMFGAYMIAINPNGQFNETYYTLNGEKVPADYDIVSLIAHIQTQDINNYLSSQARIDYRVNRASESSSVYLSKNMTDKANLDILLKALSNYGVNEEKYNTFGYNYKNIKHTAKTTIVSFQSRYDYELETINQNKENGIYKTETEYQTAIEEMNKNLTGDLSSSLLSSLPQEVSDALEEVGQADLYSLIVGSIFFKMAGLLLPIIYMIMCSNNLISGQVDSGSMAYVLSTSTKRKQVVFTQAIYLIGSLLLMFLCTTITSFICLSIVNVPSSSLSYSKLALINLGAFLVLFAMSGINFLTSCWFDRSKKSMSIGGGISIFFLVATILGLFGSQVIPSVVRLDALNYFNYVSIISFFDVVSIIEESTAFIWKLAILLCIGIAGYLIGSLRFIKKDLPL